MCLNTAAYPDVGGDEVVLNAGPDVEGDAALDAGPDVEGNGVALDTKALNISEITPTHILELACVTIWRLQ